MSSRSPSNRPSNHERRGSAGTESPPLGIYIIAILGGIVSVLGFIPILVLMGQGGGWLLIGLVLFALNVAQLYVLVGLVNLEPWAWTWALVLYGIGAVIDLILVDIVGVIITLVIVVYLLSKADYYEK